MLTSKTVHLQLRIDDLLEELSKKEAEWCSKEEKLILEVQNIWYMCTKFTLKTYHNCIVHGIFIHVYPHGKALLEIWRGKGISKARVFKGKLNWNFRRCVCGGGGGVTKKNLTCGWGYRYSLKFVKPEKS